jgi:hypothetical protein
MRMPPNPSVKELLSPHLTDLLRIETRCKEEIEAETDDINLLVAAIAKQKLLGPFRERLSRIARVCLNNPDADFWLQRRGSEDTVGRVKMQFQSVGQQNPKGEDIGICVTRPDIVNPDYLRAWFEALWRRRYWRQNCYGMLNLQHIRLTDVAKLPVTFAP